MTAKRKELCGRKGKGGETGTRGVGLTRQRSRTTLSFSRNQRRSTQKERDRDSLRIGKRVDTKEGKGQKRGEAEGALPLYKLPKL